MPITNPDWIPPIEMTFDVGKPIRSEQGMQLAGNPIAIAEGAVGAPRVRGSARVNNLLASGNLPTGVNAAGVSGLASHSGIFVVFSNMTRSGGSNSAGVIEFSANNGGSWTDVSGFIDLTSGGGDRALYYETMAASVTIIAANFTSTSIGAISLSGGFTVIGSSIPASVNAVRVRFDEAAANFTGGTYAIYGITRGNE